MVGAHLTHHVHHPGVVPHHALGPGGLGRRLGLLGVWRRRGGKAADNRSGGEERGEFAGHVVLSSSVVDDA